MSSRNAYFGLIAGRFDIDENVLKAVLGKQDVSLQRIVTAAALCPAIVEEKRRWQRATSVRMAVSMATECYGERASHRIIETLRRFCAGYDPIELLPEMMKLSPALHLWASACVLERMAEVASEEISRKSGPRAIYAARVAAKLAKQSLGDRSAELIAKLEDHQLIAIETARGVDEFDAPGTELIASAAAVLCGMSIAVLSLPRSTLVQTVEKIPSGLRSRELYLPDAAYAWPENTLTSNDAYAWARDLYVDMSRLSRSFSPTGGPLFLRNVLIEAVGTFPFEREQRSPSGWAEEDRSSTAFLAGAGVIVGALLYRGYRA